MTPPAYFEAIRASAAQRWAQLERDPDLAAPWHQLFKQVQSPRHVLSELLQNADDADATEASVFVTQDEFRFTHNGKDFTEENFASLCRFGYSNKRALHTIGFRGIGFKSIFSLGDPVTLITPTLTVAFDRKRFTEPRWSEAAAARTKLTVVRVGIADQHRRLEIERNLREWLTSPVSLLFFRNIRSLQIGQHTLRWRRTGRGPSQSTEWVALESAPENRFLIARSDPQPFPPDALAEIRQERLLGVDQDLDFPPCTVDLVLGAKGRLHAVLPTGVETALPFACNAPFVQDPARLKIRDPETSPTNRWLLSRAGTLAAQVMLEWVGRTQDSLADRAAAYQLLPNVDRNSSSLEGGCAAIVETAFELALDESPFLLTDAGALANAGKCVRLPHAIYDAWPSEEAVKLFNQSDHAPLSRAVSETDTKKLLDWDVIGSTDKPYIISVLKSRQLPRPSTWQRLLNLWNFLAPEITSYWPQIGREDLRIVPVQGQDLLFAANEVVRLGDKRLLNSDDDWAFLSTHLRVLNPNWPRFLAERRRAPDSEAQAGSDGRDQVEAAYAVLKSLELESASEADSVLDQVASAFFDQNSLNLADCVRLAQIAAKLGASSGDAFKFVTRDMHLRSGDAAVLFDQDGMLGDLLPNAWANAHLLHQEYSASFTSCSAEEWKAWVSSGQAGLHPLPPISTKSQRFGLRERFESAMRDFGYRGTFEYPYQTSRPYPYQVYAVEDFDFDTDLCNFWAQTPASGDIWQRLLETLLHAPDRYWRGKEWLRPLQTSTNGQATGRVRVSAESPAAWLRRLRDVPCLRDTHGNYRIPRELLRRTPETEALIDVEPFVHSSLDTEHNRPLLILLGVYDRPSGPERLLSCLRALTKAPKLPIEEIEKWYRRLDHLLSNCSTKDANAIGAAFQNERIILTADGQWLTATTVYLQPDEDDVPGAAVIPTRMRELSLWRRVGVAERPTADLAIRWLSQLPSGRALSPDDVRRVRAVLARHAVRIWTECRHWINLLGEWVPIEALSYALTMQSLVQWSHLHEWVKRKTADLQRLPADVTEAAPFALLPHLSSRVEDRFHRDPLIHGKPERRAWLCQLGAELRRIELDDQLEVRRVHALAAELAETMWQTVPHLEVISYIDGTPAGLPRRAEVIWMDRVLYVEDRPIAKLARAVSQELGRAFRRQDVVDAIKLCFDRSADFVSQYVEANFTLSARAQGESVKTKNGSAVGHRDSVQPLARIPSPLSDDIPKPVVDSLTDLVATNPSAPDTEIDHQKAIRHARTAKPSIMARFAHIQGFRPVDERRFTQPDGTEIVRSEDDPAFWERRKHGEVVCYYWAKDHCLEREPLQLDAAVWGLVDQFPELYSLILLDLREQPVEIEGTQLREMKDRHLITLYPASYRLVYQHDGEASA